MKSRQLPKMPFRNSFVLLALEKCMCVCTCTYSNYYFLLCFSLFQGILVSILWLLSCSFGNEEFPHSRLPVWTIPYPCGNFVTQIPNTATSRSLLFWLSFKVAYGASIWPTSVLWGHLHHSFCFRRLELFLFKHVRGRGHTNVTALLGTNRPSEAYARLFSGNEVSFDYIYK